MGFFDQQRNFRKTPHPVFRPENFVFLLGIVNSLGIGKVALIAAAYGLGDIARRRTLVEKNGFFGGNDPLGVEYLFPGFKVAKESLGNNAIKIEQNSLDQSISS